VEHGQRADGVTSFELMQQSADAGYGGLVHFAFDLLELDGVDVARLPLLERTQCTLERASGRALALD
jgi:ATP-dependent DNA ligase